MCGRCQSCLESLFPFVGSSLSHLDCVLADTRADTFASVKSHHNDARCDCRGIFTAGYDSKCRCKVETRLIHRARRYIWSLVENIGYQLSALFLHYPDPQ